MSEPQNTGRLGYRINEVCNIAGIGRTLVYRLVADGKLDVVRVGGCTIVTAASLEALLTPRNGSEVR
jgi:excisionase family DNA binding protein